MTLLDQRSKTLRTRAQQEAHIAGTAESNPIQVHSDCADGMDELEGAYRRERPRLLRLLARRTTPEHAEDIIQSVFARLVARGPVSAAIQNLGAYLREAASNAVIDQHRTDLVSPISHEDKILDRLPATSDPIRQLEARDCLARLETALLRLKPITREIFLARRLDGYSYEEISERTGMSVGAVEKQIARALKQLGRRFD